MKTTFIMTEDGRTEVQWWLQDKFVNRTTKIYSGNDFDHMKLDKQIPIPDRLVICDFCDSEIHDFPVAVLWNGSYALCEKCFKDIQIDTNTGKPRRT